jgi:hypothetical protein
LPVAGWAIPSHASRGAATSSPDRYGVPATRISRDETADVPVDDDKCAMIELIRANDIVLIGFARSILEAAEIPVLVADSHMSLMEGSIGVFGQRLLVPRDHEAQARRLLADAGIAHELRQP